MSETSKSSLVETIVRAVAERAIGVVTKYVERSRAYPTFSRPVHSGLVHCCNWLDFLGDRSCEVACADSADLAGLGDRGNHHAIARRGLRTGRVPCLKELDSTTSRARIRR
jgi:hypothetical protein